MFSFLVWWYTKLYTHVCKYFNKQEAVTKAEGLLNLHQEYQRNLKAFEVWLEKEQEKLDCLSHLDGDAQKQEATLRELQVHNVWHPK